MKFSKVLALVLSLVMVFSFAACSAPAEDTPTTTAAPTTTEAPSKADTNAPADAPEIKDATDKVTFDAFSFKVNGKVIDNAAMKDASIYKIKVETVNSKGNASENTYGGYAIKDVLKAAGCPDATKLTITANDGYEVEFEITDENAAYSLVAIEKDKEMGEDGTVWFAPCLEKTASNYAKLVVEITAK
ncbi:MAG: hypothetical protein PUD72_08380 [Oscillospiraceae bacterium]|nr:hypothetical protein [Oscillospiraceae bacterium]